jgi:hypothetical protein
VVSATALRATGQAEGLRLADASPFISFYNSAQTTRFGYIQHTGANLVITPEVGALIVPADVHITSANGLITSGGTFAGASAGEGRLYGGTTTGVTLIGRGSAYDVTVGGYTGATAFAVPTGTANVEFFGSITVDTNSIFRGFFGLIDGAGTTSAMNRWVSYKDAAATERAWVGYGEGTNRFSISNTIGNVRLIAPGNNIELTGSAVYINGSTAWHAGNDGAGSGLDADLLGGWGSGQYTRTNQASWAFRSDGTVGYLGFAQGSSSRTGYMEFNRADGVRQGYIGFGDGTSDILITAEIGKFNFNTAPYVGANVMWHAGNLTPGNYALLSGANFSGPVTMSAGGAAQVLSAGTGGDTRIEWKIGGSRVANISGSSTGLDISTDVGSVRINSNAVFAGDVRSGVFRATASGTDRFALTADASAAYMYGASYVFNNLAGTVVLASINSAGVVSATDFSASSDIKFKTNIRPIENALCKVEQMRGIHFTRKADGAEKIGLIAQELEAIIPELVNEDEQGKSISYANLTAVLIEAVKELSARVATLEAG